MDLQHNDNLNVCLYNITMTHILLVLSIFLLSFSPVKAEYFLWEDSKSGLTLTFPDNWKMQTSGTSNEILRIAGPGQDNPMCRVKAKEDKRYTIFPSDYGDAVQREAVSIPFWKDYMTYYDDYTIDRVFDGGGLGRWLASYAFGSYMHRNGTAYESRQAIMFASLYYDTLYVIECSTLNNGYDKWGPIFRSIIKSVDFKKTYHEHQTGEYANFLKEADLYFWAQTGPEGTIGYK